MINVTKTFLPPFEEYTAILKRAWEKAWLTNNGELVLELEATLKKYLQLDHLLFTSNGTIVLQIALKALGVTKEVITTPFSYVATTNAILWEGCTPVFVDIKPSSFCIDEDKIEQAITSNTQAILATHVYGYPCNVEKIEAIARKHNLKVIYDAAHSFGVTLNGRSVLSFGDISTCSFHATKVFHTVEGGCIICHDKELNDRLFLNRSFGHIGDDYFSVGINGKNSEFHAAMGLANFQYLDSIINKRKGISELYDTLIAGLPLERPVSDFEIEYNYAYYPVVFADEASLLRAVKLLGEQKIFARRYFYPSLNTLPFLSTANACPISEDISKRVLSLPLSAELTTEEATLIVSIIKAAILAS